VYKSDKSNNGGGRKKQSNSGQLIFSHPKFD